MTLSVNLVLTQESRPFKIDIYGLQDDFIGTLQSYNDSFIGQVVSPSLEISDDGSQTFTCSIPKFYINPETNLKVENPRWTDINKGILAENTRVLKVFLKSGEETKVYPFIVDKITDKRDSHFSVYKSITASGLAFAELGKQGYKLELNSHTLETDYEEDNTVVATINYWLDKVFPNERDASGNVVKWLSPWCYEVKTDWRQYTTGADRATNKIYEDPYISSWGIVAGTDNTASALVPKEYDVGQEKARYIDCSNSNKYNITQTIAETFGVFCSYEYKCDNHGRFIDTYTENGKVWQGRKITFYNRAIKSDEPLVFDYKKNLNSFSRELDSSDIYTKLYVTPIESDTVSSGYISIADTPTNPLLDEFIYNFDYLYEKGSISDYQMRKINEHKANLHTYNTKLLELSPTIETYTEKVNNAKADEAVVEKEIESARETLQTYQTLRDNDVTNEAVIKNRDNSYSIIFVKEDDCYSATIRLAGVVIGTMVGYRDYTYQTVVFPTGGYGIKAVNSKPTILSGDKNFYIKLDEYGFPSNIYAALDNDILQSSQIIYLALTYSPKNAYVSICEQLTNRIEVKQTELESKGRARVDLEKKLKEYETEYEDILAQKEADIQNLELILGPALREGYWSPTEYEDPGEAVTAQLGAITTKASEACSLIYDKEYFDGEETGYYYDEGTLDTKKYYGYIKIKNIENILESNKIENLTVHLRNPSSAYTVVNTPLAKGAYFIYYNSQKKYFTFDEQKEIGTKLEIRIASNNNLNIYVNESFHATLADTTSVSNPINATPLFEGINNYLGERLIYNNAGFIFSFIGRENGEGIEPVLLLNNTDIKYEKYQDLTYSFDGKNVSNDSLRSNTIYAPAEGYTVYYPRIFIDSANVNYDSDLLTITKSDGTVLEKYDDYSVLTRNGRPYFTLKITNENPFIAIMDSPSYTIVYQLSRASEMLYLDAKEVALENSRPKFTYTLGISNIPNQVKFIELGQLTYINDFSLGTHAATGYVSGVKYDLSDPSQDTITIKNYKTKFEDLFSTITASSEAMKNNAHTYGIAAGSFTASGELKGSVLQNALANNNLTFNFSTTNTQISDEEGITLTNSSPYMNGVYGQVALRGGGIFLSNSIDSAGNRVWNTAITPSGINASLLTTGQLDTEVIKIYSGSNMAFQWNGEGIYAYRREEGGAPDLNTYVKYSQHGLQYISGDRTVVDLGWNGLLISTQEGATELTGDKGLVVYQGEKNAVGDNYVVRLGRFEDDGTYGLRLYKKYIDNETITYSPTLITSNDGELWLKDSLRVGSEKNVVGITGAGVGTKENSPVRIWAGGEDKELAPFWVKEDGSIRAAKASIEGSIIAKTGEIGGWTISENALTSKDAKTSLYAGPHKKDNEDEPDTDELHERINVNGGFIVYSNGSMKATNANIEGHIVANSGSIGGMSVDGLAGNLDSLIGDVNEIRVHISSSHGTTTYDDEEFETQFIATVYKGNVEFTEMEYQEYKYYWEYSTNPDEEEGWTNFITDEINYTTVPQITIKKSYLSSTYVRCSIEKITIEGGESSG